MFVSNIVSKKNVKKYLHAIIKKSRNSSSEFVFYATYRILCVYVEGNQPNRTKPEKSCDKVNIRKSIIIFHFPEEC